MLRFINCLALLAFLLGFVGCAHSESWLRSRVAMLRSDEGSCSGEQVRAPSGVSYILTAAHCSHLAVDGYIKVITEGGKVLHSRVIAEDLVSDLLLLEGIPGLRGLDVAREVKPGEAILTLTHGGGRPPYRTDGIVGVVTRVDAPVFVVSGALSKKECLSKPKLKLLTLNDKIIVCLLDVEELVTTALVIPGSSGGPALNASGELIGVVSIYDESHSYLVKLSDIQRFVGNY